jgi:hypothetical protein
MARGRLRIARLASRTGALRKTLATFLLCAAALMVQPAEAANPAPIKLAVFDFELEDFSAGGSPAAPAPSDATHLADVTNAVRQLLTESARYQLVDVGNVDLADVKARMLSKCDGCDAPIALKLGAEQSLVGVVKRISRTEYTVRFQIRDARTGDVVSNVDSGLRMGADYSWSRGATRLIKDRLLAKPDQQ